MSPRPCRASSTGSKSTISTSRPAATSPTGRSTRSSPTSSISSTRWARGSSASPKANGRAILVGDLNIAPLEHDVWSHKALLGVVSHTPIEVEKLTRAQAAGRWYDALRHFVPHDQKLYTWWSYRSPDWAAANKGRRLDHVWVSPPLADAVQTMRVFRDTRGWERPSRPRAGEGRPYALSRLALRRPDGLAHGVGEFVRLGAGAADAVDQAHAGQRQRRQAILGARAPAGPRRSGPPATRWPPAPRARSCRWRCNCAKRTGCAPGRAAPPAPRRRHGARCRRGCLARSAPVRRRAP